MKKFLSTVFTSCLGTLVALSVIVGIFMIIGTISSSKDTNMAKNSILTLKLEGDIPELTDNIQSDPLAFQSSSGLGLRDIIKLIDHASSDDRISGIVLKNRWIGTGGAGIAEITRALKRFKDNGKFIYSYADFYSQSAYTLASVSDSIFLNSNGSIDLKGYSATIPFYKDMFDKVGIKMDIFYAGNYKSATEPYRRNNVSEPNREQIEEFLSEKVGMLRQNISDHRNLSIDQVDDIMSKLMGHTATLALENNLVDVITYETDFEDFLRKKLSIEEGKKINYLDQVEYKEKVTFKKRSGKEKIALIIAEGEVAYGNDGHGVINEKTYTKIFEKIRKDEKIKAVVYRINSPGGNALTSDILLNELKKLQADSIPVIASFGDYAASGGYYIAASCDTIVAEPNTLTGSIGVYMMFPDATKLFNDKIGIRYDTIKTHPLATNHNPLVGLSEADKEILNEGTQDIYKRFVQIVADGRDLPVEKVKKIAQGRVWTGTKAKSLGLVDELGGLERAFELAAEMAGLDEYKVTTYPRINKSFMDKIFDEIAKQSGGSAQILTDEEKQVYGHVRELKRIANLNQPQARLPFIIDEK